MDRIPHVLIVSQEAPLPLVVALAISTIVGVALLVRIICEISVVLSNP